MTFKGIQDFKKLYESYRWWSYIYCVVLRFKKYSVDKNYYCLDEAALRKTQDA